MLCIMNLFGDVIVSVESLLCICGEDMFFMDIWIYEFYCSGILFLVSVSIVDVDVCVYIV